MKSYGIIVLLCKAFALSSIFDDTMTVVFLLPSAFDKSFNSDYKISGNIKCVRFLFW